MRLLSSSRAPGAIGRVTVLCSCSNLARKSAMVAWLDVRRAASSSSVNAAPRTRISGPWASDRGAGRGEGEEGGWLKRNRQQGTTKVYTQCRLRTRLQGLFPLLHLSRDSFDLLDDDRQRPMVSQRLAQAKTQGVPARRCTRTTALPPQDNNDVPLPHCPTPRAHQQTRRRTALDQESTTSPCRTAWP